MNYDEGSTLIKGDVTLHFNHYYLIPICQYHHIIKLLQIQYNNPTLYKGRQKSFLEGWIPLFGTFYAQHRKCPANGKCFFILSTTLTVLKLSSLSFTNPNG